MLKVVYALSRVLLMLSIISGFYCVGILAVFGWPASGYVIGGLLFLRLLRHKRIQLAAVFITAIGGHRRNNPAGADIQANWMSNVNNFRFRHLI